MNRLSMRPLLLLISLLIMLSVSAVHGASRSSYRSDKDRSIELDDKIADLVSLEDLEFGLLDNGNKLQQDASKHSPLIRTVRQATCIERGSNCDGNVHGCCSGSSCRCNLWGANCRCAGKGLF